MNSAIPATLGPYKVLFKIGDGAFSTVYHGIDNRTGKVVALKFVDRKSLINMNLLSCFERELRITERLSHKSIVACYDTIFTDKYIVIVMENLRSGTLTSFKQYSTVNLTASTYLRWGKEILEGLQYLHERGVSHHDIKPDNIGFDDNMHAKIFDFGLCEDSMFDKSTIKCGNACGTPYFFAPEVMTCDEYDGAKSDIWSFGVTFYYMVTGRLPYPNMSYNEFIENTDKIESMLEIRCGGVFEKIVRMALVADPKKRPSAKEMLESGLFNNAEIIPDQPFYEKDLRQIKKLNTLNAQIQRRASRPSIVMPIKVRAPQSMRLDFSKKLQIASSGNFRY